MWVGEIQDTKITQKIAICTLSHNFVWLFLRNLTRDIDSAKRHMAAAIAAISSWSRSYRLKLNDEKSEVIWLGTQHAATTVEAQCN